MRLKRVIIIAIVVLLLAAAVLWLVYGRSDAVSMFILKALVGHEQVNHLTLTVYYLDGKAVYQMPIKPEQLKQMTVDNERMFKYSADSTMLKEKIDLLKELVNVELKPIEDELYMDARICYTIDHKLLGELLEVVFSFRDNAEVYINGVLTEGGYVYYDIANVFLPEDKQINVRKVF